MRLSGGNAALRSAIAACTSTAQRTASTTLANSTSRPSPVVLTMRPRCSAIFGSISSRAERLEPAERAFLVGSDQPRIAGHIGREDRREPTFDASWPCGLHGASSVADDPTPTSAWRALSNEAKLPSLPNQHFKLHKYAYHGNIIRNMSVSAPVFPSLRRASLRFRCFFVRQNRRSQGFLRWRIGRRLIICCKQQQKQRGDTRYQKRGARRRPFGERERPLRSRGSRSAPSWRGRGSRS